MFSHFELELHKIAFFLNDVPWNENGFYRFGSFRIVQISGQCQRSNQRVDSNVKSCMKMCISMWTFMWKRKNIYLCNVCLSYTFYCKPKKKRMSVHWACVIVESLELIRPHQIHINFNGILVSQQRGSTSTTI